MKKIIAALLCGLALLMALPGCYNDNEYDLYPFAACDSTHVTYNTNIAPIMASSCNVCHSASIASGGYVTDNYNDLSYIAQSGKLWGCVKHLSGFKPMPQNAAQLSSCDLAKIHHWINEGYPNN